MEAGSEWPNIYDAASDSSATSGGGGSNRSSMSTSNSSRSLKSSNDDIQEEIVMTSSSSGEPGSRPPGLGHGPSAPPLGLDDQDYGSEPVFMMSPPADPSQSPDVSPHCTGCKVRRCSWCFPSPALAVIKQFSSPPRRRWPTASRAALCCAPTA